MKSNPELTAIDILLNPDETMVKRAVEINKRMLTEFPEGFQLDESHIPHVSVLQRYVRTKDLKKVYDAVERVITAKNVVSLQLNAAQIKCLASSGTQGLAVSTRYFMPIVKKQLTVSELICGQPASCLKKLINKRF